MRILVVHSFYRLLGGEDRYVQEQVSLLEGAHDVRLFSARNDELSGTVSAVRAMTTGYPERSGLRAEIEDFRPDVIHVHNSYPALGPAAFKEAKRARIPLVMTLHNYRLRCPNGYFFTHDGVCERCEGGNYLHSVRHNCLGDRGQSSAYAATLWLHRFAYRVEDLVAAFVAPSEFLAQKMIDSGLPASKVVVVPNFVVANDLPEEDRTFGLYVGRLSPEKGVVQLVQALRQVHDLRFRIIGTGPSEPELRAAAADLPNVELLGQQSPSEVREALRAALFLVVPSVWYEVAGLVALEALAAACPVLVSEIGGLGELVTTGAGRTFPPGDVEAMVAALRVTASDHPGRARMGEEGRRLFEERYSPEKHRGILESVYRRVIGEG